jgi:hypothetical protein
MVKKRQSGAFGLNNSWLNGAEKITREKKGKRLEVFLVFN